MPKIKRLAFKGDHSATATSLSTTKKKSSAEHQSKDKSSSWKSLPDEGWLIAESMDDLKGPLLLLFCGRDRWFTLYADADKGLQLIPLSADETDLSSSQSIEPLSVQNVIIAHPLPNNPNNYSLKTAHNTYLGCDSFGVISCDKIAVGPQEEWTAIPVEGGYSFQSSCYQTFLQAQEDGGQTIKSSATGISRSLGTVRCDSQTVGSRETWVVKCQAAQKKARLRKQFEAAKKEKGTEAAGNIELDQLRRFHSLPAGHQFRYNPMERELLSDAQSKGKLNETLLESRIKMKSDKYCKYVG